MNLPDKLTVKLNDIGIIPFNNTEAVTHVRNDMILVYDTVPNQLLIPGGCGKFKEIPLTLRI